MNMMFDDSFSLAIKPFLLHCGFYFRPEAYSESFQNSKPVVVMHNGKEFDSQKYSDVINYVGCTTSGTLLTALGDMQRPVAFFEQLLLPSTLSESDTLVISEASHLTNHGLIDRSNKSLLLSLVEDLPNEVTLTTSWGKKKGRFITLISPVHGYPHYYLPTGQKVQGKQCPNGQRSTKRNQSESGGGGQTSYVTGHSSLSFQPSLTTGLGPPLPLQSPMCDPFGEMVAQAPTQSAEESTSEMENSFDIIHLMLGKQPPVLGLVSPANPVLPCQMVPLLFPSSSTPSIPPTPIQPPIPSSVPASSLATQTPAIILQPKTYTEGELRYCELSVPEDIPQAACILPLRALFFSTDLCCKYKHCMKELCDLKVPNTVSAELCECDFDLEKTKLMFTLPKECKSSLSVNSNICNKFVTWVITILMV